MATIATKHLSDTAKKGRFGDTELVHVNKQERDLLKALGGSGTINPETGLREYFDPFTALGFGLSLYQTHQQSQSQKSTARTTSKYAQQGINELETAEKHLETAVGARKDLAEQTTQEIKKKNYDGEVFVRVDQGQTDLNKIQALKKQLEDSRKREEVLREEVSKLKQIESNKKWAEIDD